MKLVVTVVLAVRAERVEVRVRGSFTYDGAGCDCKQGSRAANKPRAQVVYMFCGTVVLATGVLSLRLMYMHVSILCTADSRMRVGLAQRDFLKRYFNNIRQNFDKHG